MPQFLKNLSKMQFNLAKNLKNKLESMKQIPGIIPGFKPQPKNQEISKLLYLTRVSRKKLSKIFKNFRKIRTGITKKEYLIEEDICFMDHQEMVKPRLLKPSRELLTWIFALLIYKMMAWMTNHLTKLWTQALLILLYCLKVHKINS